MISKSLSSELADMGFKQIIDKITNVASDINYINNNMLILFSVEEMDDHFYFSIIVTIDETQYYISDKEGFWRHVNALKGNFNFEYINIFELLSAKEKDRFEEERNHLFEKGHSFFLRNKKIFIRIINMYKELIIDLLQKYNYNEGKELENVLKSISGIKH